MQLGKVATLSAILFVLSMGPTARASPTGEKIIENSSQLARRNLACYGGMSFAQITTSAGKAENVCYRKYINTPGTKRHPNIKYGKKSASPSSSSTPSAQSYGTVTNTTESVTSSPPKQTGSINSSLSRREFVARPGTNATVCGPSSFTDSIAENGAPGANAADCECVRDFAQVFEGMFLLDAGADETLIACGTCFFAASTTEASGSEVGNQDIVDLINDAIDMFEVDRMLAVNGELSCRNGAMAMTKSTWTLGRVPSP